MKLFKDNNGKEWILDINVGTIELVKARTGVDLTKLFEGQMELLGKLFSDPVQLVVVLWAAVRQPDATDDDRLKFYSVLRGDALESAATALVEDVIDFFPNRRQREIWRETVKKLWEVVDEVQTKQAAALQQLNPTSLVSVGESAELSALIPAL